MKKGIKKLIAIGIIASSICTLSPVQANAAWQQNSNGWWNTESDSWSTGWRNINNKWYCFDSNGYMKTGWLNDNGNWYYLDNNGSMVSNVTIDGCKIDNNGVWCISPVITPIIKDTNDIIVPIPKDTIKTQSNPLPNLNSNPRQKDDSTNNNSAKDNDKTTKISKNNDFSNKDYCTITYDYDKNVRMATDGKDYESDTDKNNKPYPRIVVKASDYGFTDGDKMMKKVGHMKISENKKLSIEK